MSGIFENDLDLRQAQDIVYARNRPDTVPQFFEFFKIFKLVNSTVQYPHGNFIPVFPELFLELVEEHHFGILRGHRAVKVVAHLNAGGLIGHENGYKTDGQRQRQAIPNDELCDFRPHGDIGSETNRQR